MLPFFPEPYWDELAYSVFARYHHLSGNISFRETMWDLFQSKTACAVLDLPNRLQILCNQMPDGSFTTPESIIQKNTLFPLFEPFLPQKRALEIIRMMKESNRGGSVHNTIGIMASSIPRPQFLRVCPECLVKDEERYGETYWHRVHQVFGVFICPLHHVWLCESNIAISSTQNKHCFSLIDPNSTFKFISPKNGIEQYDLYCKIAEYAYWLLNHSIIPPGMEAFRKRYTSILHRRELTTLSGRIQQHDLINEFTNFFGRAFLQNLKSEVDYSPDNWLSKVVRKPRAAVHPIRHILLMLFLEISPEQIFNTPEVSLFPFGRGPWPCMNPVSGHYRKLIIKKVEITQDSKLKCPVGHFKCTCGFHFSRRGPDKRETDRFKIGRIQNFGPIWEKKLLSLIKERGKSIREIAKILNVDSKTIINQLTRINGTTESPKNDFNDHRKEDFRNHWLEVINDHPDQSKTKLRCLIPRVYIWLYRNDRDWLTVHSPQKIYIAVNNRVDWNRRDKDIYEQAFCFISKIKDSQLVRITKSLIGKGIGQLMIIQKHIDKLPLTCELLNKVTESKEQYRIRRIRRAILDIKSCGQILKPWKIARLAGIRPEYMSLVLNELNLFLIYGDEQYGN